MLRAVVAVVRLGAVLHTVRCAVLIRLVQFADTSKVYENQDEILALLNETKWPRVRIV